MRDLLAQLTYTKATPTRLFFFVNVRTSVLRPRLPERRLGAGRLDARFANRMPGRQNKQKER